jgi:hypothetical protein
MSNSAESAHSAGHSHESFWLWVMCLTGVDYFSSLGYQPSIAFKSAGMLAPLATIVLVAVTMFGALPLYIFVARKSFTGQGSIGMLAKLVSGWPGKILVLVLLGFAATDFVITKTLSAADAAEHMIQNPKWPWREATDNSAAVKEAAAAVSTIVGAGASGSSAMGPATIGAAAIETTALVAAADRAVRCEREQRQVTENRQKGEERQRLVATFLLLVMLGGAFMRGFREVVGLAAIIVGVFLALNFIVIVFGTIHVFENPHLIRNWYDSVAAGEWHLSGSDRILSGNGWLVIVAMCLLIFPKLALGLSGFETGVAVMPLIKGNADDKADNPQGRIRNTKKLLIWAATIMSFFLITSSFVVCTMIPPDAFDKNKQTDSPDKKYALDRALAYLAHGEGPEKIMMSGEVLGTIYDISTVVILWFAGASAMAGLLNLVPQYLPRYGMAPEWARAIRPLVILLTVINLIVTWIFNASVDAQSGAYATGVLVLITSAGVASVIERWRENKTAKSWRKRLPWGFFLITLVFMYTTLAVVIEKPEGIKIAACFIGAILATSLFSRVARSRELRFDGFHIPDAVSKLLWDTIKHFELSVLVPHRPGRRSLASKETAIRREHRIPRDVMIIFVEVELTDASEFNQEPWLEVREEDGRYVMKISHAASIAHTLAAVALEMAKVGKPPEIHFGWTEETPWSGVLGFLLFGEGNVPWMVRELIRKAEPIPEKRPFIVVAGA